MATSVEPNRARPRAPDEVGDGGAERSLQPGLERENSAAALVSELAFYEGALAPGQAAVGGAWMVGERNRPARSPRRRSLLTTA